MQQNKNDSYKIPLLIAILFSLTLAFIILRDVLLSPGLIEWTADFSLHYDISWNRQIISHTWNPYTFDLENSATLSTFSVYSWLLMLPNSEIMQRVMLFLVFTLIPMNMFVVVFDWVRKRHKSGFIRYASPIVASLVYTINPWVATETVHWFSLWSYAFIPLIFYLTLKGINGQSWKTAAECALILSLIVILTGTAYGIIYSLSLMFILMFLSILFSRSRQQAFKYVSKSFVFLLTLIVFSLLLAAFWLLPYLFYFSPNVFQGKTWAIFKVSDIFSMSQSIGGISNVARLYYPWTEQFLAGPLPTTFSPIMTFLSLSVPITAVSAILLRKKDKTVMILSILALLFIFLAKGSEEPLGGLYVWLAFNAPIISSLGWVLFKSPYIYLGYLSFSYAFLSGITVSELLYRSSSIKQRLKLFTLPKNPIKKSMFVPSILLIILAFSVLLNGNPLLSGDLNGYYSPVSLPKEYQDANDWLSSKEGDFRVAWLPPSSNVFWSPYTKLAAIPDRGEISPLPQWASSEPVLSLGVTYLLPTHARIFPQYYAYDALLNNKTLSVGKLYGLANVKYVEYHSDSIDSENYTGLYESLLEQRDLKLAFNENYLSVFSNEHSSPYVYATKSAILNVGGLDALIPLSNIESYVPYELPIVFLEQFPMKKEEIDTLLDFGSVLQFYGDKDFDDLTLSSLSSNYIFAPSEYLVETSPLSPWDIDFFYSHLWVPNRLGQFQGAKYDFDMDKKIILTNEPADFSFWITTPQTDNYEVWVRTLRNPQGGRISVLLDDTEVGEIITESSALRGFKWMQNGKVQLTEGKHKLTINNKSGFNAINLIAVVPSQELENHRMSLLERIVESKIRLSYLTEEAFLDDSKNSTLPSEAKSMKLSLIKSSNYVIAIRASPKGDHGSIHIGINGQSYTLDYSDASVSEYRYVGPIYLTQKEQKIDLVANDVKIDSMFVYEVSENDPIVPTLEETFRGELMPFIINYKRVSAAEIAVTVNASQPFILALAEGYHAFWNGNFPKAALNSITNGFLIEKTGIYTVRIEFAPETYFQYGILVSQLSLVLMVCVLVLLNGKLKRALVQKIRRPKPS